MFNVLYWEMFVVISLIWVGVRAFVCIKNQKVSFAREMQLLMVYICIVVISRIVYFPWHHVDGHIAPLVFDASKMLPPWYNLVPVVHLFDIYDGWQMNIIGNITMFIPVGIVWPVCFKQLNTWGKTVLAGALYTLLIEISQIPFYGRCSDVDDMILNTTGVAIGALIYFACKRAGRKRREKDLYIDR